MTRLLTVFLLLSFLVPLQAQINVGSIRRTQLEPGEIEAERMAALREAQTLFVMRPGDKGQMTQIQAILDEVWTVNDIAVVSRSQLGDLLAAGDRTYATLAIEGHATTVQRSSSSYTNAHYYLHLSMVGEEIPYTDKEMRRMERRGEEATPRFETWTFARAALYPDGELVLLSDEFRNSYSLSDEEKDDHMNFVYNKANFYNDELGFLKNMLQEVNRYLEAGETRWYFASEQDDNQLRRQTLYVPDYLLIKFNKFNGNEDKRHEEEDLFGNYEYNYQLIPADELNEMILNAEEPFYYFNYTRSSTDAFYTVTNALTGEIIYCEYDPATYNIKGKNISALNRAISKL